jgi:protoporphyrinogen oxidase
MKIAIIGGGGTGLAAAYDLARANHDVVVYEVGAEVGGLAAGFRDERWEWSVEKFYHHWFSSDSDVLELIEEIGHTDKVLFPFPTTSLWTPDGNIPIAGKVVDNTFLSLIANVLGITPLPLFARLRFGVVGFVLRLIPDGTYLEKHTADAWLLRVVGRRAHELIWRPLLIGKFGPMYDRVNMAWFWARAYKRTPRLGTYVGGFQAMLDDLADAVRLAGGIIHLNLPVDRIAPIASGGFDVVLDGRAAHFDAVLSTTSPRTMLALTPDLPDSYAALLRGLKSMGAVALILALDRQLMTDSTYWLNLPARSPDKNANPFPFLALVEHTNYVSPEHFGGEHIVYLGDYVPPDHEYFRLTEEELAERFVPSLTRVNPDFSPSWIRRRWLFRAPYAQPVPLVNQSERLPAIRTPLHGLYFASMSQVYPWDRGTNYAVEMGRRTARMIMADYDAPKEEPV